MALCGLPAEVVDHRQALDAPAAGQCVHHEVGAPRVVDMVARVAESVLPAQLLDPDAGLSLPQETDDLLFGKSALLHVRSLFGKRTLLTLGWTALRGAGQ